MNKLIENYINKIKQNDINRFANQNGISLTNVEIEIIYKVIKNDWRILLYGNSTTIFNNLKNTLNSNSYNKAIELFNKYKQKYKDYL